MSPELKTAASALAAPAALALLTAVLLLRVRTGTIGERFGLPLALVAGLCAGYWLLGEWTALVPQRHRQWLPYLAMAAALAGRSTASSYPSWLIWALLAGASAWLLVPTWETLWPPQVMMIPLVAAYLVVVIFLLNALPDRLLGRLFVVLLAAAALTVALLIAIGITAKVGLIAVAAAAALAGCALANSIPRKDIERDEAARALASRSLIPLFAVLFGGLAFVGAIEPDPPLPILLIAPAAPLTLWIFAAGPLAKLQGWKSLTFQATTVLLPLGIALAIVVLA